MFLLTVAHAQPGNPQSRQYSVYKKLDYPIFSNADSLTIIPNPNVSEEEDFGYPPGRYPTMANCKVNNKTVLHLSEARLKGDTLIIKIVEKNPSYFYSLKISILADSFKTKYSFNYPESEDPYEVLPTDQLLVLSSDKFSQGDEIRGFINFRGTGQVSTKGHNEWSSKEDYIPSDYVIRGPFRAVIE
jgi:hypothetical protein